MTDPKPEPMTAEEEAVWRDQYVSGKGYLFSQRLAATLDAARAETEAVRRENERLRAALAQSDRPCAYCSLPADEWAKCQQGFPGCDRADDAMGCPELGARLEADALRALAAELVEGLAGLIEWVEIQRRDKTPAPKRESRDDGASRDERDQVFGREMLRAQEIVNRAHALGIGGEKEKSGDK